MFRGFIVTEFSYTFTHFIGFLHIRCVFNIACFINSFAVNNTLFFCVIKANRKTSEAFESAVHNSIAVLCGGHYVIEFFTLSAWIKKSLRIFCLYDIIILSNYVKSYDLTYKREWCKSEQHYRS